MSLGGDLGPNEQNHPLLTFRAPRLSPNYSPQRPRPNRNEIDEADITPR